MKINSLKKQKQWYLIYTWSDKAIKSARCELGIAIFAWSVTWNKADSPFKLCYGTYVKTAKTPKNMIKKFPC